MNLKKGSRDQSQKHKVRKQDRNNSLMWANICDASKMATLYAAIFSYQCMQL